MHRVFESGKVVGKLAEQEKKKLDRRREKRKEAC